MNRILLAILALFAGLAAQAGTAQARTVQGAGTEIGTLEVRASSTQAAPAQAQLPGAVAPAVRPQAGDRGSRPTTASAPGIFVPTLIYGVDRALE